MRFIHLYLVAYFVLLIGAAMTLWQAGALGHISAIWAVITVVVVVGLGVLLAVTSARPVIRE